MYQTLCVVYDGNVGVDAPMKQPTGSTGHFGQEKGASLYSNQICFLCSVDFKSFASDYIIFEANSVTSELPQLNTNYRHSAQKYTCMSLSCCVTGPSSGSDLCVKYLKL